MLCDLGDITWGNSGFRWQEQLQNSSMIMGGGEREGNFAVRVWEVGIDILSFQ